MTVAAMALPMPKLRIVRFSAVADCIGWSRPSTSTPNRSANMLDVVDEVAQQDVLAELVERAPGVPRQPVLDDLGLGLHVTAHRAMGGQGSSSSGIAAAESEPLFGRCPPFRAHGIEAEYHAGPGTLSCTKEPPIPPPTARPTSPGMPGRQRSQSAMCKHHPVSRAPDSIRQETDSCCRAPQRRGWDSAERARISLYEP